jgi:putative ABC transport system permease protein
MSLGEILFVYRARLRDRAVVVQELLAVLGIAVGVALLFASQIASTSLDSSVRQLARQLVGTTQYQLDARGSEGFSERVLGQVQSLPGVSAALPLLEQKATVAGPRGRASVDLIGADPRFAHAGGPLLRRFSAKQLARQRAIALPSPLARQIGAGPLEPIELQLGARVVETLLGATLQEADVGALVHSPVALAPVSYAQELTGMRGRVSRVFVEIQHGRRSEAHAALERLASANQLDLQPAGFDASLFAVAAAPAQQSEDLFAGISAIVGFLFAFNAMLLTAPERRRLVDAMRRRGTTRAMTLQVLAFDALVIGLLACLAGLPLGELLSRAAFHENPDYLSFAFPVGTQRIVTWPAIALAAGAGMLAAFVGVLAPLHQILARPLGSAATAAGAMSGLAILRAGAGTLCLAVTTAILLLAPRAAVAGTIALLAALLILLPFIYEAAIALFDRLQRPLHASSTILAITELRDPLTRVRSLGVAATGAIAVFGSVAIAGAQHNLQAGLDRTAGEWNRVTDLWVTASGLDNTLATTAFPSSIATKVSRLPGVRRVAIYRGGFLDLGDRRAWVIAPPRTSPQLIPPGQLTAGDARTVNRRLRGRGWAVVSEAIARQRHLRLGSYFTLPAPHPARFRVAALSTNGGWPPGILVLNADDYAHAWSSHLASALNVDLNSRVSPARARAELQTALGPHSGLAVQTAAGRERQWKAVSRQGLGRLSQIATLVLVAAILAIAGVMASMIWQRRERIAYIKRQGFTRGLLWRALFFESAVLLCVGCAIGATFGLYGQLLISRALAIVTGFPITLNVGALIAVTSFALVATAALAIVAVPGYLAVRVRPTTVRPA